MRLKISLLLTVLLLNACGWHLRGVTPLPAEYRVLYMQSQAGASFDRQMQLQLEFNHVVLTKDSADAQATLSIAPLEIEQRALSLASSGKVAEFEINGRLLATLRRYGSDREVHIELRARRRLSNDINNVQGTANAATRQISELEKDLVGKLLRRLQRIDYQKDSQPIEDQEDTPSFEGLK